MPILYAYATADFLYLLTAPGIFSYCDVITTRMRLYQIIYRIYSVIEQHAGESHEIADGRRIILRYSGTDYYNRYAPIYSKGPKYGLKYGLTKESITYLPAYNFFVIEAPYHYTCYFRQYERYEILPKQHGIFKANYMYYLHQYKGAASRYRDYYLQDPNSTYIVQCLNVPYFTDAVSERIIWYLNSDTEACENIPGTNHSVYSLSVDSRLLMAQACRNLELNTRAVDPMERANPDYLYVDRDMYDAQQYEGPCNYSESYYDYESDREDFEPEDFIGGLMLRYPHTDISFVYWDTFQAVLISTPGLQLMYVQIEGSRICLLSTPSVPFALYFDSPDCHLDAETENLCVLHYYGNSCFAQAMLTTRLQSVIVISRRKGTIISLSHHEGSQKIVATIQETHLLDFELEGSCGSHSTICLQSLEILSGTTKQKQSKIAYE